MSKSGTFTRPPSRDASVEVQIINSDEVSHLEDTIKDLQNKSLDYKSKFDTEKGES